MSEGVTACVLRNGTVKNMPQSPVEKEPYGRDLALGEGGWDGVLATNN